jgi:exodeoxyribonuclease VII small subunit
VPWFFSRFQGRGDRSRLIAFELSNERLGAREMITVTTKNESESASDQPTFEAALAQLDAIVQELEEGQIGLAEGLTRYEQGVKLLKQCYQLLEHAQRRIELLSRVDSDGRIHSEPFDEGALSLEEKAQARGRRRSSKKNADPDTLPAQDEIDESGRLF